MMPHIYEIDWAKSAGPREVYLEEKDIDNSNIERILQNRFNDPLLSSEDEDVEKQPIDWDQLIRNRDKAKQHRMHIPGLRPCLHHPKLSALTKLQQIQCMNVLCARNSHVLPQQSFKEPTFIDYKTFETLQEVYEKEQKEYIEWAKTIWVTQHCGRALRPKPIVETTYEAEFKVRAHRLNGFPTYFDMAAQIPLECTRGHQYDMQLKKTLIPVNLQDLPEVELPKQLDRSSNVLRECALPEPCHKHPCQFILPNEDTVSMLPMPEIHRELSQLAAENGTRFIASEGALRCLLQQQRHWSVPVSVLRAVMPDGERRNVVVLDSEFSITKEPAMMRTYRAFKHLLYDTLIPHEERERVIKKNLSAKKEPSKSAAAAAPSAGAAAVSHGSSDEEDSEPLVIADKPSSDDDEDKPIQVKQKSNNIPQYEEFDESSDSDFNKLVICDSDDEDDKVTRRSKRVIAKSVPRKEPELSSDEEEENLVINEHDTNPAKPINKAEEKTNKKLRELFGEGPSTSKHTDEAANTIAASNEDLALGDMSADAINDIIGVYSCTCTDTPYEVPPPRSFVKWGIKNCATAETMDVIVHCAHKATAKNSSEVILEPIPEYQAEVGGSEQSPDRVRGVVLALLLREKASVVNVRIEGCTGDMLRLDKSSSEQFLTQHKLQRMQVLNVLHTALSELQELVPGHYVLKHEPGHGANAMLYVSRAKGEGLALRFDSSQLLEADETKMLKIAPTITNVLLPIHKFRKVLPCAFTTYEDMVTKEVKKPAAKQKPPPQAIKWPKKKNKKGKKKN